MSWPSPGTDIAVTSLRLVDEPSSDDHPWRVPLSRTDGAAAGHRRRPDVHSCARIKSLGSNQLLCWFNLPVHHGSGSGWKRPGRSGNADLPCHDINPQPRRDLEHVTAGCWQWTYSNRAVFGLVAAGSTVQRGDPGLLLWGRACRQAWTERPGPLVMPLPRARCFSFVRVSRVRGI